MQQSYFENWEFNITVKEGIAESCRMGFETGDRFICKYECPSGFCPKTMPVLYTLCEIIRCGGDYTFKDSKDKYKIDFPCADSCMIFHLEAKQLEQYHSE